MDILVVGQGHLGRVTAACLALHHNVYAAGAYQDITGANGRPANEPGLGDLESKGVNAGRLHRVLESDLVAAGLDPDLIWLCEDLPVGKDDKGDVAALLARASDVVLRVNRKNCRGVVLSSQVPVMATEHLAVVLNHEARVAYVPENLRRGSAIERFTRPDRVVVGTGNAPEDAVLRKHIEAALLPFTRHFLHVGWREAEMIKHAINAYLATCIVLANEISTVCRRVNVDPLAVEAGMRSDRRIGYEGPLTGGGPIRGGTLLRDVQYLAALQIGDSLIKEVYESNRMHLLEIEGAVR